MIYFLRLSSPHAYILALLITMMNVRQLNSISVLSWAAEQPVVLMLSPTGKKPVASRVVDQVTSMYGVPLP